MLSVLQHPNAARERRRGPSLPSSFPRFLSRRGDVLWCCRRQHPKWAVLACRCSARWSVVSPWPSQQFTTAQFLQAPPGALPADAGRAPVRRHQSVSPRRRTATASPSTLVHTSLHTQHTLTAHTCSRQHPLDSHPFFFPLRLFFLSLSVSTHGLSPALCQRLRKRYLCVPGEHT